jgi:hypothetical protein
MKRSGQVSKWIPCGADFIAADIIRWSDGVWIKRRGKNVRVGTRRVTGNVERIEEGWCYIVVKHCDVLDVEPGKKIPPFAVGTQLKRKRQTIAKGAAERYEWGGSDGEAARGMLTSKFMGVSRR